MEELLRNYSSFDINDALNRIERQLDDGYVDVGAWAHDGAELTIIEIAINLFKEKYSNEKEID